MRTKTFYYECDENTLELLERITGNARMNNKKFQGIITALISSAAKKHSALGV